MTRVASLQLSGSISNNTITSGGSHGLYAYTYDNAHSDLTIESNTVHGNAEHGIMVSVNADNNIIRGNVAVVIDDQA